MSRIEWTSETWNPVTGCTRASEGCDNCYAVTMTRRLAAMGSPKYIGLINEGKTHFNGVVKCHEDALTIPFKWKKPLMCFVNSMSDLFHKEVPFEFIDKVFAVMALTPHITYQVLTKRPERMAEYLNHHADQSDIGALAMAVGLPENVSRILDYDALSWGDIPGNTWPLPNVWLGTSVENQAAAEERIPHLLQCPAAVRFLSCEPLIGGVQLRAINSFHFRGAEMIDALTGDLSDFLGVNVSRLKNSVNWVIAGGESGAKKRPFNLEWFYSLKDQCKSAGVPFFMKQLDKVQEVPEDLLVREYPK